MIHVPPVEDGPPPHSDADAPGARANGRAARVDSRAPDPIPLIATVAIFAELPETQWVARALQIGPGRPTLLAGYGASAKTLAAQSLALSVAAGRPIWGHFEVGEPTHVVHLDYEQGFRATAKRYQRLALGHGIDTPELRDRLRLGDLPRVFLDDDRAPDLLCRICDGAGLVIIDSLRAAAPRLDENSSDVRRALDVLTLVSTKTGCAALLLHHAGKPQDRHADARTVARGSSAIFDAAGCCLVISQGKAKTAPRLVSQTKAPAEGEGGMLEDFALAVEDVALGGCPTAGVRVRYQALEVATPAPDAVYQRDAERILAAIREFPGATTNVLVLKAGMKKVRAKEVLAALVDEGRVAELEGPRNSKSYRVVVNP